jgi:hypothetical protein
MVDMKEELSFALKDIFDEAIVLNENKFVISRELTRDAIEELERHQFLFNKAETYKDKICITVTKKTSSTPFGSFMIHSLKERKGPAKDRFRMLLYKLFDINESNSEKEGEIINHNDGKLSIQITKGFSSKFLDILDTEGFVFSKCSIFDDNILLITFEIEEQMNSNDFLKQFQRRHNVNNIRNMVDI